MKAVRACVPVFLFRRGHLVTEPASATSNKAQKTKCCSCFWSSGPIRPQLQLHWRQFTIQLAFFLLVMQAQSAVSNYLNTLLYLHKLTLSSQSSSSSSSTSRRTAACGIAPGSNECGKSPPMRALCFSLARYRLDRFSLLCSSSSSP